MGLRRLEKSDEEQCVRFERMKNVLDFLSECFRKGVGRRLQCYLTLKSWFSTNYVTDWWKEFVYMRQRSPMINSNYNGFDHLNEHPTTNQDSRAANFTYTSLQFRRMVDRQEVSPFSISPRTKDPFCFVLQEKKSIGCCIGMMRSTLRCTVVHNGKRLSIVGSTSRSS